MFGNGMWDCDAIYCNIQESLNVHKQPEVSKRVVFHVFLNSANLCRCRCVQVMVMGGLWVAKVGFGRLKVVIGDWQL